MSGTMRTDLVSRTLLMVIGHKQPAAGLILHTHRGSQYARHECQSLLKSRRQRGGDFIKDVSYAKMEMTPEPSLLRLAPIIIDTMYISKPNKNLWQWLVGVALLCLLYFPPISPAALAQTPPVDCPAVQELSVQLEQQLSQLGNARDRLEVFVSGRQLTDVSPTSLFTVDIGNESSVQRRIRELHEI